MTDPSAFKNFDSRAISDPKLSEDLLLKVQKPCRYIGNELNSITKNLNKVKLRMALAFPDVYEVGMSHLGLKILHYIVNSQENMYAERVFAPWPDMESLLRTEQKPLVTLETGTPLSCLDFLGFSLQYELCASNVLQMLDLGGIPLRADERTLDHPIVVGGGPVPFNPIPLSHFFDAFVIGDGEEVILELARSQIRWKEAGGSREDLLLEWKQLTGVFVPSLHKNGEVVVRRVLADLDKAPFPSRLLVPFCETVHDRIGMEIARGCSRGCRFCQAGMVYRPVREREVDTILELARKSLEATGWEEVALLSLSSGDYTLIGDLIKTMAEEHVPDKVAISLPSLRTDTFDSEMAEQIRRVRKTGFTLAPEAGTDRLRRIINKGNTEEDLEKAVKTAFKQGWTSIKLYFMLGLPFETDDDLNGIIGLIRKASKWAGGGRITASVSTFVPKSHTPFQWAGQISIEETKRRQHYISRYFQKGNVRIKFHDARISFLEGVLARGDSRLSEVIEGAFKKGARFDGWDDHFNFDLWMNAFQEAGVDPTEYLRPRLVEDYLPWDFVWPGVAREHLVREWEKAVSEETTEDCRSGACTGCGVCDFNNVLPRHASNPSGNSGNSLLTESHASEPVVRRFRLRYGKLGKMRFLGHHDVVRVFHRAFRRSGLKLDYSRGFHPHPKLRFSPPTGLGIESVAEFLDFDLTNSIHSVDEIMQTLQKVLPEGIEPIEIKETPLNDPVVSARIQQVTYEISFTDSLSLEEVSRKVDKFECSQEIIISAVRKGRVRIRNLKDWVDNLEVCGNFLRMTLKAGQEGSVHPWDAVGGLLGLTRDDSKTVRIIKTSVGFRQPLDA